MDDEALALARALDFALGALRTVNDVLSGQPKKLGDARTEFKTAWQRWTEIREEISVRAKGANPAARYAIGRIPNIIAEWKAVSSDLQTVAKWIEKQVPKIVK